MKVNIAHVVFVAFQGLDALLGLVVPDLDGSQIGAGSKVGLVAFEVIDAVNAVFVAFEGVVGGGCVGSEVEDFDGFVKAGTGEGVGVTWVDSSHHHIMRMLFIILHALKLLPKIKNLNMPIIR